MGLWCWISRLFRRPVVEEPMPVLYWLQAVRKKGEAAGLIEALWTHEGVSHRQYKVITVDDPNLWLTSQVRVGMNEWFFDDTALRDDE